jgi:hypothetical protein
MAYFPEEGHRRIRCGNQEGYFSIFLCKRGVVVAGGKRQGKIPGKEKSQPLPVGFLSDGGGGGGNRTRVRKPYADSSTYLAWPFGLTRHPPTRQADERRSA